MTEHDPPGLGDFIYVVVAPEQLEAAVAFYERLQDTTESQRVVFGTATTEIVQVGGFLVVAGGAEEVRPFRPDAGPRPLLVDDVRPYHDRLVAAGAEIVSPIQRIPTGMHFRAAHPDGTVVDYVHRDQPVRRARADRAPDRYPTTSWLTNRAAVDRSPIHGRGLFAIAGIRAGEPVMRLGGQVIDDHTLAALTTPYDSLTVADGVHLLLDPDHPVRYGNHACDPNMWHRDATLVVARCHITAGEELTIDYATHTGVESWSMRCRCGRPACRGTVTGGDWRLPHLQRAYGQHWSPALLARIAAES